MIKYFYYEEHFINNVWNIVNEKILYEKPDTNYSGYKYIDINENITVCYIDVEKYIEFYGEFNNILQDVYDKLLIQAIRNKKLETL